MVDNERPDGRDRAVRRPDAAEAGRRARRRRRAAARHAARVDRTWPRTAAASATCSRSLASAARRYGVAHSRDEALRIAEQLGYPLLVRPSFVLGGRAMQIVYDGDELATTCSTAVSASAEHPVLIDKFLEDAIEVDVDAVCDGEDVFIGAIMQHVEEAGIHSGDSSCVIPSLSLGEGTLEQVRSQTTQLALALGRQGPAERAVRLPELRALRARGQPARLAHGAVRQQGYRRAARQARDARDPRRAAGRLRPPRARARARQRQGGRAARSTASRAPTRAWARR